MIIFLSVFPPYRGGIARFSDFLFRALSKDKEIKAYNFKALYPEFLFPGSTQYENEPSNKYSNRVVHSFNPFSWGQTGSELAKEKPESLIISYWHPFFIFAYAHILKKVRKNSSGTKIIVVAHNIIPHEKFPFSKNLMEWFFKKTDLVITLSEQTSSELSSLNADIENLKLFHPIYESDLPLMSELDLREKYGFDRDDNIVLFFGIIREYKGLDILIDALNKLALEDEKIKPLIVGEFYDDKNKYVNSINPEHKSQYTIIDRFVSAEESAELFSISDLLVLPYKSASQSGVLADALNFNLPCLVADHAGLTEHIEQGKDGLVFESENSPELSSKISGFFSNKSQQEIIKSNIRTKKDELSWEEFSNRLVKYLAT
ncbi:MAG: glycosyltransferase [Balneola sp.]